MKPLAILLAALLQAPDAAPPATLRPALRQLRDQMGDHPATFGAAPELTVAKHQLRDWVESRMTGLGDRLDPRAFAETLHKALAAAGLLCTDFQDECYSNLLGYVDDVRVYRQGEFLVVVTATGIRCGYDESAYVYAWNGQQWRRVWELEQNTYTEKDYKPQLVHDVQISSPDAKGARLLMVLGSQAVCGGSFKDLYAGIWRMETDLTSERLLDWFAHGSDGYPPLLGRVRSDDVLFEFTSGGIMSGQGHTAVRHFRIEGSRAIQVDPVAGRPHDFVVEWLTTPWEQMRSRSEAPALEAVHAELYRSDGIGDFPERTLRCGAASDLWQVGTNMFEGPKRYYRVRWKDPFSFTMVGVSETPYPDCTVPDPRADVHPNLRGSDLR